MPLPLTWRRAILAAHNHTCHYCGMKGARTVDHIVALSVGGSDRLGNLIAACTFCNISKGNRRLPPDQESAAAAKAEAMVPTVLEMMGRDEIALTDEVPDRVTFVMTPDMREDIRRWRFANQIASEAEAIRELLRLGLAAQES